MYADEICAEHCLFVDLREIRKKNLAKSLIFFILKDFVSHSFHFFTAKNLFSTYFAYK